MDIPIEKKGMSKGRLLRGVLLLLVLILVVFAFRAFGGKESLKVEGERLLIGEVVRGPFQENIPVNGLVMPITTIYLDAVEGGRVEKRFVEEGALLKKGDPILKLANTDLELSLVNQETAVYNLLTQMQISQNASRQNTISRLNQMTDVDNAYIEAERVYQLNKRLYDQKAIGKQELIEAENNFTYQQQRRKLAREILKQDSIASQQMDSQEKSSYARTRSALELMRQKVEDLTVRAPVDGQLTSLYAEIGESKNKGERLGQIDVMSGFKVRADIDEHYISRIQAGQQGSFQFAGKEYQLEIRKVYTQVVNGRFQVDMVFPGDKPQGIRRGQSLQVRLALSQEKEAVMIPKGGFYQKTGGNWIFKLSEDGKSAYRVSISLGSQNAEHYEVLEGLIPGDRVITSGYENFGDFEELTIQQ